MSVYVFTGPTLSPEEARAEIDAIYLPPVSQGDVYRVSLKSPRAIGIIDGYFECVPAVWHKEILWAMTQGIHVYGSGSMGALRAVELAAFGMEGVGAIFEAYRDGTLEDDDEVAVAHGPAETRYRPLSVAMVNIRFTLSSAVKARVISSATRAKLERIGKDLFYPDRTYPRILEVAAKAEVPEAELRAFREWLPRGEVNQKRTDALAMLRSMRQRLADNLQAVVSLRLLLRADATGLVPAVEAMVAAVQPDGMLGWVQRIGDKPGAAQYQSRTADRQGLRQSRDSHGIRAVQCGPDQREHVCNLRHAGCGPGRRRRGPSGQLGEP